MLQAIQKVDTALAKIERLLMFLLSSVVIISMVTQVICRYVLYIATPWAEEVALYGFMWGCWIGSAYAVSTDDHLSISVIDSLINRISDETRRKKAMHTIMSVASIISFAFLAYFTYLYIHYFLILSKTPQLSPVMHLPMTYVQATGVVGGVLMTIHAFFAVILRLFTPLAGKEG